jgi:protein-disulfide isomerase
MINTWAALSGVIGPKFKACLATGQYETEVQEDYSDGINLGVRGTPTFFLNGKMIEGVVPYDVFVSMIESELGQD